MRSTFTVGAQVTDGGRTGTVVPHERLAYLCRPVAVTWWDRCLLALARRVRPTPPPPPVTVEPGRSYDDMVPVAWDDGSVSVTRAHLLRATRRVSVGVAAGA